MKIKTAIGDVGLMGSLSILQHFMGSNNYSTSIGVLGCRPNMRKNGLNFVEPCFCVRIENATSSKKSSQLF
jgi:hypothetical protein